MLVRVLQILYVVLVWLFTAGVAAQAYLAGMSVFASPAWQAMHSSLGWLLALVGIALPVLAFVARLPRALVVLALVVFGLMFVQVSLVTWVYAFELPSLTALHPLNALLLFYAALVTAHRATRVLFARRQVMATAAVA